MELVGIAQEGKIALMDKETGKYLFRDILNKRFLEAKDFDDAEDIGSNEEYTLGDIIEGQCSVEYHEGIYGIPKDGQFVSLLSLLDDEEKKHPEDTYIRL
jgi:hypothetical protein